MNSESFQIKIEGDYLTSFIYSGVLILVDSGFMLHALQWDQVVNEVTNNSKGLQKLFAENYLLDSSNKKIPKNLLGNTFYIDFEKIKKIGKLSVNIGVWPSDINIYKNRIYISSERGVDAIDFEWDSGRVGKFLSPKKIWSESSFSISSNSFYRLAIAAGKNGVISYIPRNREISISNSYTLIESVCVDCDWQDERLIANTEEGVELLLFDKIPNKSEFSGDDKQYWNLVNEIKSRRPSSLNFKELLNITVKNCWNAGSKTFFMTNEGSIGFVDSEQLILNEKNAKITIQEVVGDASVNFSRTATFGTVIEIGNSLNLLGNKSVEKIDEDMSSWRIFPRSRNYANHLHVIKDDHIAIKVIGKSKQEDAYNDYGF